MSGLRHRSSLASPAEALAKAGPPSAPAPNSRRASRQHRPVKINFYFHIRMNTIHHRTGMRGPLKDRPRFLIRPEPLGKIEHNMDARNPPRIRFHDFLDRQLHPTQIHGQIPRFDPHRRRHTRGQRGCYQVGGTKTFPLALVIRRRIRLDFRPRLQVGGNRPQISLVNNC